MHRNFSLSFKYSKYLSCDFVVACEKNFSMMNMFVKLYDGTDLQQKTYKSTKYLSKWIQILGIDLPISVCKL